MNKLNKIKTFDKFFLWCLFAFFIVVAFICCLPFILTTYSSNIDFTSTNSSTIGDTIGGIMGPFVAIAAAGLTFLAFWVQFKANEQQKQDIRDFKDRNEIEKLEMRFFEMLKFHRENVSELTYSYYIKEKSKDTREIEIKEIRANGRKVIKLIFEDFKSLNLELEHFFTNVNIESVYEESYFAKLQNNKIISERKINYIDYAKIDIFYCILYFGLSIEDQNTLKEIFSLKYKRDFFEPIISFAALKPIKYSTNWEKWVKFHNQDINLKMKVFSRIEKAKGEKKPIIPVIEYEFGIPSPEDSFYSSLRSFGKYDKYYGGHQFRLGHYFRHIYQMVTLINLSKLIDYNDKYANIKLLRGQLSTIEQVLIFLNSISSLGRIWEFEIRNEPEKSVEINNQLITKYNFIKNIFSDSITKSISILNFFPNISYEAISNPGVETRRRILKEQHYQVQFKNTYNEN